MSLIVKYKLSAAQFPVIYNEKSKYQNYTGDLYYLSIVRSLLFATQSQPDIQHTVSMISQFGSNPSIPYLEAAKHILHYLKGIMNYGLMLGCYGTEEFDLVDWTDSNWTQDPNDYHSVREFVFKVAGGTVTWLLKKQPTVATFLVEAEYMTLENTTKEAVWLRILLRKMGFPQVIAIILFTNN